MGPIDPTRNATYKFIRSFFQEVFQRFPDTFVHLGGDEVSFTCWHSNPLIEEFMIRHGWGNDYRKLEAYYIERLIETLDGLDAHKTFVVWQEVELV